MFEEINAHRQAVQENIEKAFEVGFTGNEDLEKAHQVGDIHPNGKWVWTQLPSGKYDWRLIKKQSQSTVPSQQNVNKQQKTEDGLTKEELEELRALESAARKGYKLLQRDANRLRRLQAKERELKQGDNSTRGNSGGRNIQSEKNKTFDSEYDAQKLEHLSEDELSESAKKFGVKTRLNRYGEIYLRIESKKEVNNLKKFLSSNGIEYDESKLSKQPGFYGTHSYGYDLYSGKQENSIGYYERKARYIQNDIDYLTNSSKNHPDVRQRAAAKKELENGSLKRELDEVKEKIASLKKMGK